jgi:hypothetical protein
MRSPVRGMADTHRQYRSEKHDGFEVGKGEDGHQGVAPTGSGVSEAGTDAS